MQLPPALLFLAPGLLGACGAFAGDCTTEARAMIVATVTDANSAAPLVAGVTLVAASGTARDSVVVADGVDPAGLTTVTLFEGRLRGGVYAVEVRRTGYETWRREGVLVREEQCGHTLAVPLSVALTPSA